jgi:glycosyltransferase involved in cell wall biosynthesis
MAQQEGIPIRIPHSQNTTRHLSARSILRKALAAVGYRMINSAATHLLGISKDAAVALFGEGCLSDPRLRIMPPAISLDPFRSRPDKAQVRAQLGLPVHAPVIGHVGRFAPQKNHRFLIKVAALVVAQRPETRVLLVGAGPLRGEIENRSRALGIADNVVFAGERQDVPALMMAGMDVLLFPSRWEGLGRVIVEAQAAGLPCIISDVVPREADAVPALITRMSLSDPAEVWAERVLAALDAGPTVTQEEALGAIKDSPLNIERNVRDLERLYTEAVATVRRSQAREGGEPEGAG